MHVFLLSEEVVTDFGIVTCRGLADTGMKDHVVFLKIRIQGQGSGDGTEKDLTLVGDDHFVTHQLQLLADTEELGFDFLHEAGDLGIGLLAHECTYIERLREVIPPGAGDYQSSKI